jgi:hypothetical protein
MAEALFNTLSPDEREIAESILKASPNYRYDLRGLPPLDPPPTSGPAAAAAAAKAMAAWLKSWRYG